jgi:hypothetical protein
MHESLGGAFPKRHHVDCGLIAIICKVPVLGRYTKKLGQVEKPIRQGKSTDAVPGTWMT